MATAKKTPIDKPSEEESQELSEQAQRSGMLATTGDIMTIQKAMQELVLANEDNEGHHAQALEDTLEALELELEDKAVAILQACKTASMPIMAIDDEIARLKDRKQKIENAVGRMRGFILENMKITGIKKITHPLVSITLVKGRDKLAIDEDDMDPEEHAIYYLPPKVETRLDRSRIQNDLKNKEGKASEFATSRRVRTTC